MPYQDQDNYIDPQMNNQPLAFNNNRGKPPMPVEGGGDGLSDAPMMPDTNMGPINTFTAKLLNIGPGKRQKSKSGGDGEEEPNMGLLPMPTPMDNQMGSQMGGGGMMMGGGSGFFGSPMDNQMGGGRMMGPPMMGGGMNPGMNPGMNSGMNPSMNPGMNPGMMNQMMMFGGMGGPGMGGPGMGGPGMEGGWVPMNPDQAMGDMMPLKEIIRLDKSVLYPPVQNAPMPTTRERPPGCRTIFVGGLPETSTEEMLEEVFSNFGKTTSVRKSKKKNFAHVRFEDESGVDRSLFLSGYRMKVDDQDDKANTGRLHVDFAMARDDQYEYECKQRSMIRDMRHRQRMEEERLRPPSPPPITQYSDYEAAMLTERLRTDDDFMKASQMLLTWLERGDANRRNISSFYSLIQCTNAHIRRLLSEKQGHEEELLKMKEKYRNIFEGILKQFDQIEKVFGMAQKQRNWDHFTKPQRKNIEMWLKQCREIKQSQQEEFLSERKEDEMEMSDDDEALVPVKKKKTDYSADLTSQYAEMAGKLNQINTLQDDNDALKCQIEAYKNELALAKMDRPDDSGKEMKSLQMALQGMQQQLMTARSEVTELKRKADQDKANFLIEKQLLSDKEATLDRRINDVDARERRNKAKENGEGVNEANKEEATLVKEKSDVDESVISSTGVQVTDKEAKLMGLVCCFLHVHPTGASVDYIWSYLHRLNMECRVSELESLLEKLPMIFMQEVTGVGATIERRWLFTGYKSLLRFT